MVLHLSYIPIKYYHENKVSPWEEVECLLKVQEVIQGRRAEVRSNEVSPIQYG